MDGIVQNLFAHPWLSALAVYLCYHTARAVYLIYLSPLAIFPGSKWAALGEYWEAYWNIGARPGRKGQTLFKLEEMHKRLGPSISTESRVSDRLTCACRSCPAHGAQ